MKFAGDELVVELEDGRVIHVPIDWFPRLRDASATQRSDWRLIGGGIGIHWPQLDEDLSVRGLLTPDVPSLDRSRPKTAGASVD